jgi:hypothetical protein
VQNHLSILLDLPDKFGGIRVSEHRQRARRRAGGGREEFKL